MGSDSIQIGVELNQTFRIDALIGAGGMGEVFKGHNIQTGDPVAIKVLLPEFARNDMILELFRKEARVLNHLSHDAIVRYHVFSMDRSIGRPYLAMEFVSGPSLSDRLRAGPLSEEETSFLQKRLADGLLKAHEAGVIHRDISPDNFILPNGDVKSAKIIDFGIARSANVGGATLLGDSFAGKYNYVSPEQLGLYGGDVTRRSDIYSLGLVLAAALRGTPLNMQGSPVEVIEKRRAVPDLATVPERFRGLLSAMLEPDPAKRLQSMAEVRDWAPGLSRVQGSSADATIVLPHGMPVQSAVVGLPERPPVSPLVSGHGAKPERAPERQGPRRLFLLLGALAVVVVLGVLAGVLFIDREKAVEEVSQPATMNTAADTAQPDKAEQTSMVEGAGQAASPDAGNAGAQQDQSKPSTTADIKAGDAPGIPSTNGSTLPASEPKSAEPATGAQPNVVVLEPPAAKPSEQTPQAPTEQPAPKAEPPQDTAQPPSEPRSAEQVAEAQPNVAETQPNVAEAQPNVAEAQPNVAVAEPPAAPPPAETPQVPEDQPAPTPEPPKDTAVLAQPKPPPILSIPQQMENYVVNYQGGDCFFVQPRDMLSTPVRVLGMGASIDVFESFMASFTSRFGSEPSITLNQVTPRQCPAVNALKHLMTAAPDGSLSLRIESSRLPVGGTLRGGVAGSDGRHLDLLFVSEKGETFKLTSLLRGGQFSVQFGRNSVPANGERLPQLLLLVASNRELSALSAIDERQPRAADLVFPALIEEAARETGVSVLAHYFWIQS
jgi:serine/threonine protein kinase